jgi:hypothetical protein
MKGLLEAVDGAYIIDSHSDNTVTLSHHFRRFGCGDNNGLLGVDDGYLYMFQNGTATEIGGGTDILKYHRVLMNSQVYTVRHCHNKVIFTAHDEEYYVIAIERPRSLTVDFPTATLNGNTYIQIYNNERAVCEVGTAVDLGNTFNVMSMCVSEASNYTVYGAMYARGTALSMLDTRCNDLARLVYQDNDGHRAAIRICNMQGNIYIEQHPYDGTHLIFDERVMAVVGIPGIVPWTRPSTLHMFFRN